MYDEIGALQERLDALNPKERVELLIKLMPYALLLGHYLNLTLLTVLRN